MSVIDITDDNPPAVQRRTFARNAATLLASQLLTWTVATALSIVQPRFLGAEGLGQLRIAISLWAIAEVLIAFGSPNRLTIDFASDPAGAAPSLATVLRLQTMFFVAVGAGLLGFAAVAGYDSDTVTVIAIASAGALGSVLSNTLRFVLYGLERMDWVALGDVVARVVSGVAIIAVLVLGGGVRAVAGLSAAYTFLALAVFAFAYRRLSPSIRHMGHPSQPLERSRPIASMSAVVRRCGAFLAIDATVVIYLQVGVVMMSLLASERVVGWYGAALVIFGALLFLPNALMTSLFPVLARLHAEDPAAARVVLRQAFAALVSVSVPIGTGLVLLGTPATTLLFGRDFANAGTVLSTLGVVIVPIYLNILLSRYAMASGRQAFWSTLMLGATAVHVVVGVVAIAWAQDRHDNGAIGAVVAFAAAELMVLVVSLWRVAPELATRSIAIRCAKVTAATAAMAAVVVALRQVGLVVSAVVGGLVYLVGLYCLRTLDDSETAVLRRTAHRIMDSARRRRRPHLGKADSC